MLSMSVAEIGGILGIIAAALLLYRLLVQQKDANIQVLRDRGCLNFCVRGAERLVHGGGRRLRQTTDAVGKSVSS